MINFILRQIYHIKNRGFKEIFRKSYILIKILLIFPLYAIAIIPSIIIRFVSPWFVIRIERVASVTYGRFAEDLARYYCKKKLRLDEPTKKHLDLFYIHYNDKIYNKQLAKMWKRKFNFFSGFILDPINKVNRLIPGWKIHAIKSLSENNYRDPNHLIERCAKKGFKALEFSAEEEIYGKKMLKKFGLNENDKFVCFAVRDSAYQLRKSNYPNHDWSYHDYRNEDIDKFRLVAEELARRGYYVFRMGVVADKPMKTNNPKIIDYVNTKLRNDFLDVYLGAKCSFCLSTGTGFHQVPYVFGRPIALMNLPVGDCRTDSSKILLLTKHHVLKKEKRKLTLSEIFSHDLAYIYDTKEFEKKGIELIDYTPDQIKALVIEMIEYFIPNKKLMPEDEELQKLFKSSFAYNTKKFKYYREIENPNMQMHGQIKAQFCTKFLRENKDWLK